MLRRKHLLLAGLALLLAVTALLPFATQAQRIPSTENPAYNYDRWALLGHIINEVLIPLHQDFVVQSDSLIEAAQAFQAEPTQQTLSALRDAWHASAVAWHTADIAGPDRSAVWRNQIYKEPVNAEFVEEFIADSDTIDAEFIANVGSTAKGLTAIEYLIFPEPGAEDTVLQALTEGPRAEQRVQYIVASAEAVKAVAEEYVGVWSADGEQYINSRRNPDQIELIAEMNLRMLTNKVIDTLEFVLTDGLGTPLGRTSGGEIRLDLVLARRSGTTTDQLIATLRGFQIVFNGGPNPGDGPGYDDHLIFVEATFDGQPTQDVINAQIDLIVEMLEALEAPFDLVLVEDPAAIDAIYEEMRTLVRYIKADMTSQLAISLVFSDNDGD